MRSGLAALLAVCAAAAVALVLVAAADRRQTAFAFVPRSVFVVGEASPGDQLCQRGLQAPARFDAIDLRLGTGGRPGPPLDVTVRGEGGRTLATGTVAPGARDNAQAQARIVPAVPAGTRFDICFRNDGRREVGFYGGSWYLSPGRAYAGRRRLEGNVRIVFLRDEPRSALSLVPDMFRRAALFRPDPVGAWTFWLLLVLVVAGIPALLALALRAAGREEPGAAPRT
jgi:hypothetical protein